MSNAALNTIVDNAKQASGIGIPKLNPYEPGTNNYLAYELGWEGEVTLVERLDGQVFGLSWDGVEYHSDVPFDLAESGEGRYHETIEEALEYLQTLCWTTADSAAAQADGWDLFETIVDGKVVLSLQRDDDEDSFPDDAAALSFVRNAASTGNRVALKALELTGLAAPETKPIFNAGNKSTIGDISMSDILGEDVEPEASPEWAWVQENASYAHRDNGKGAGVWEFMLNMSRTYKDIPEKLVPVLADARENDLSYILIHNGT
ncbi:chemotaxis protein CheY [Novimethylophilus kurashikiensis]|uniref:Chemotaxis protein CheY n=1 Tax=Novimethylophilus kurashikiensis TaxID=1825523 RepID=A0A2R5F922_9PROT|nr:hypothetical protein [Novimethylophilus kurashikiensis]GBG14319.1 chemotaxis protein CheY [Novimethylophilus kurashikiensis]